MRRSFIVVVIILLVLLGVWLIFPRHRTGVNKDTKPVKPTALPAYASTDAEVSMTINGPITSQEQYRSIKITISKDGRNVTVFQGYEGSVAKSQQLDNNQNAFSGFLYALDSANFTAKKLAPSTATEQGSCPQGRRIIYNIVQDGKTVSHLWTTNCSKTSGTFNGSNGLSQSLFEKQIPEYSKITKGVLF